MGIAAWIMAQNLQSQATAMGISPMTISSAGTGKILAIIGLGVTGVILILWLMVLFGVFNPFGLGGWGRFF